MNINKQEILKNICYTELVYGRINKKLKIDFSKQEIEDFIFKVLKETEVKFFMKKGKNFYIGELPRCCASGRRRVILSNIWQNISTGVTMCRF